VQLEQVQHLRHPRPGEPMAASEGRLVYTPGIELAPELLGQGERLLDRGRLPHSFPRFQPLLGVVEVDHDVGHDSPATGSTGEQRHPTSNVGETQGDGRRRRAATPTDADWGRLMPDLPVQGPMLRTIDRNLERPGTDAALEQRSLLAASVPTQQPHARSRIELERILPTMARRRPYPKRLDEAIERSATLRALDAEELRTFIGETLDQLDPEVRRPIEDALLRQAATRGAYRPAPPSFLELGTK
jgi:hypothetical protein